jgi:hypothetical protein
MTFKEIKKLHERCLAGTATPDEQMLFEQYKDQFDLADIPWTQDMGDYEEIKNKLREDLDRKIDGRGLVHPKMYYWPAAASVLVFISLAAWFALSHKKAIKPVAKLSYAPAVIKPGSNKAILILANSNSIALDSSKLGNVASQSNTAIIKNQKHVLQYKTNSAIAQNAAPQYNMLITPRGGQYELQLADGTKVWLNAESSLRFPVNFTGKERVVELTGEAYFEVARNKNMPFKVMTGAKTVQVLGTHFNVSAYPNETYRTTLLEGSVKLDVVNGGSALLHPGEQGVFDDQHSFNVTAADTAAAVAWKNGIFLFRNESITNIMKQVSRWYDLDVIYQGNVSRVKLGGSVSRYANISNLLNTIELTGSVHFKLEGRRVIVMQ